jgi:hypothetical protein
VAEFVQVPGCWSTRREVSRRTSAARLPAGSATFVTGMQISFAIAATLFLATALLSLRMIRS